MGLHDEDVRSANRFVKAAVNFAVGKFLQMRLGELDAQLISDVFRQCGVTTTGNDYETTLRKGFHAPRLQEIAETRRYDDHMVTAAPDEFRFLRAIAHEHGLPVPSVRRLASPTSQGALSMLQWGAGAPQAVFLHGLGQNAHTFDAVAVTLQRSLVSVDLPGHGWSDAAPTSMTTLDDVATSLIEGLEALSTTPLVLVGMSLGGLCALALAHRTPMWWSHLVLLDITPGATPDKARSVHAFLDGPESFDSYDAMVARSIAHYPTRSPEALARGVALNARERSDGRWVWHHQSHDTRLRPRYDAEDLWGTLASLPLPVSLLHGTRLDSVVDDVDLMTFRQRRPHDTVLAIEGAGHSLQSDAPTAVAGYLDLVLRTSAIDG